MRAMRGVVVMATGGRQLYCGLTQVSSDMNKGACAMSLHFDGDALRLVDYSTNPAEAVLEALADPTPCVQDRFETLIRLQNGTQGEAHVKDCNYISFPSNDPANSIAKDEILLQYAPSRFWQQFRHLSHRQLMLIYRHPYLVSVNLLLTVVTSVLCGAAFWQLDRDDFDSVLSRIGLFF